jgi:hypothetical protein
MDHRDVRARACVFSSRHSLRVNGWQHIETPRRRSVFADPNDLPMYGHRHRRVKKVSGTWRREPKPSGRLPRRTPTISAAAKRAVATQCPLTAGAGEDRAISMARGNYARRAITRSPRSHRDLPDAARCGRILRSTRETRLTAVIDTNPFARAVLGWFAGRRALTGRLPKRKECRFENRVT